MKTAAECLAFNLRNHRKQLNLSLEKLAEMAGLTPNYIQKIESSKRWPSPRTLAKLAKALKVKEPALFYDPDIKLNAEKALKLFERLVREKR